MQILCRFRGSLPNVSTGKLVSVNQLRKSPKKAFFFVQTIVGVKNVLSFEFIL